MAAKPRHTIDAEPLREETKRTRSKSKKQRSDVLPQARSRWTQTLTWSAVALTTIAVPCVVSVAGRDPFRAPKEFVLRGGAILIAAAVVFMAIFTPSLLRRAWAATKPQMLFAAITVAWAVITTATSTNRVLSAWSLVYLLSGVVFFLGACLTMRDRAWSALYVLFVPALINTGAVVLQEFRIWDFGALDKPSTHTGLIGNGNDVGAYLLCPAVIAAALCIITPVRRSLHIAIAIILGGAIVLSQSLTAMISYAAGIVALAAYRSWKRAMLTVGAIALVALASVALYSPLRNRAAIVERAIITHDYGTVSSFRLTPFMAGLQMFAKHPAVGVGPGCYGFWYFDEKIAAETRYATLRLSGDRLHNYGEAHNDYLQTLAVAGLPGLAILIAALSFLGSLSFRPDEPSLTAGFSRAASLPIAVAIAVLMLASFPIEMASPLTAMLYSAAICTSWRAHARHS